MAEKRKERESKGKEKSLIKPLTKMKNKDDEVHICGTDIQTVHAYVVQGAGGATVPLPPAPLIQRKVEVNRPCLKFKKTLCDA